VKLHEGVSLNNKLQFFSHRSYELSDLEIEAAIMENTLQLKKQALFFLSTRKNAEALAERLAGFVSKMISTSEKPELTKLSDDVLNVLETPTKQCKRLALCVRNGTAFHHAGLLGKQKRLVEDAFRNGLIKVITSTPTLALGVNLPAFRVVIRDPKRFYAGVGSAYIPVMEYRQMIGRAGRPKYDEFGESILVAKSEEEAEELVEKFIQGEVEEIRSRLAVEPILRMHTLALIASGFARSEESLLEFFSKTFYSFQYGNNSAIQDKIIEILGELVEWGFIDYTTNKIEATKLGKRVSELYIDPQTAHNFLESLKKAMEIEHDIFSLLHVVCSSKELEPKLNPKTSEIVDIGNLISQREELFLQEVPEEWDIEFDDFVRSVKTAMLFEEWMDEATDDQILAKFNMAPGEMRNKIDIADWLIYSMHELALLSGYKDLLNKIRKLRIRMSYGVKEELVPLVKLEQVGRVRARRLYKSGFKSLDDLRKAPVESLAKIVGKKTADLIKKQVGEKRLITKSATMDDF
jgi:helicase